MAKDVITVTENVGKNLDFISRESYNLLKTNISYLVNKENEGIVLGITSSEPQEGKSYTALNLAYSYAQEGKKTLIIDSDLRRSYIHERINLDKPEKGFSTYLAGHDKSVKDVVISGVLDNENLSIILAGPNPPNPYVLLISPRFKEAIDTLKKEYDIIIIDLPPVNSVSDTLAVKDCIDGVVLVVRHNVTRKKALLECVNMINFVKLNLIGIVYNGYYHGNGNYYTKKYYRNIYRQEK